MPSGRQTETPAAIVVGIGASAGGAEALVEFFSGVAPDSGMAFVVVQHLSPSHQSMLVEILARRTPLPVFEIVDGAQPLPNCVYVLAPDRNVALSPHGFRLFDANPDLRLPIDHFFKSLAESREDGAIVVVLSGNGADGSSGLRAVKEHGGLVFAQSPNTALHPDMPQSAIDSGLVDFVLPASDIAEKILLCSRYPGFGQSGGPDVATATDVDWLQKILILVRERTQHDFSNYKRSTLRRRAERRMALHQIADLGDYYEHLIRNPKEIELLFGEFIISVTSFFRDPDSFAALKTNVLDRLFAPEHPEKDVRVWVAGCATGEEAYSIAILLAELREAGERRKIQVFGTDIDPDSIQKARLGRFPLNISAEVGPDRLKRYFVKGDKDYAVSESVRGMILFAVQSFIRDPPFSRLDLISCRNVLIYLEPALQKRVLTTFHYALKPGGFLFLGSAEIPDDLPHLFKPVDRLHHIFQKTGHSGQYAVSGSSTFARELVSKSRTGDSPNDRTLEEVVRSVLIATASPSVLVDVSGEVLYVHGLIGKFLEVQPGRGVSSNAFSMAREGLKIPLASLVHRVASQQTRLVQEHVRVQLETGIQPVRLVAHPTAIPGAVLVQFQEEPIIPDADASTTSSSPGDFDRRLMEQDRELQGVREYLQSVIEELEASNEELRSTNEELQSANEELETSREELQSVAEELTTLNSEHETKIEQLTQTKNDLANALTQVDIGIIFLDRNLCIRQFNPAATRISSLIPSDVGRPLGDIVSKLKYANMVEDARVVFETLVSREVELQAESGRWYSMHIRPYRTVEDLIDGVTMTFYDVTLRRLAEEKVAALARDRSPS